MKGQGELGERLAQCKALADRSTPLTAEELAEYDTLRAREMARAEARRRPRTQQLELDKVA
jgi:hypothetical protein